MLEIPLIEDNIGKIRETLSRFTGARLVAVTKNHPVDAVIAAYHAGVRNFGENRVQELMEKRPLFEAEFPRHDGRFHFMGTLQKNKSKFFNNIVDSYDSFFSRDIYDSLEKKWNSPEDKKILLQINTTGEGQKGGLAISNLEEIYSLAEIILEHRVFILEGLMTMGPTPSGFYHKDNPDYIRDTRKAFSLLRELKEKMEKDFGISLPRLSMGMSDDFEIALEEGSSEIRLGSVIFGQRYLPR